MKELLKPCYSFAVGLWLGTDPLETAREVKLALHHVEEDGDSRFAQFDLWHKRHLQNGSHHLRDELDLVGTWKQIEEHKTKV